MEAPEPPRSHVFIGAPGQRNHKQSLAHRSAPGVTGKSCQQVDIAAALGVAREVESKTFKRMSSARRRQSANAFAANSSAGGARKQRGAGFSPARSAHQNVARFRRGLGTPRLLPSNAFLCTFLSCTADFRPVSLLPCRAHPNLRIPRRASSAGMTSTLEAHPTPRQDPCVRSENKAHAGQL
jgi:hypothetical protein